MKNSAHRRKQTSPACERASLKWNRRQPQLLTFVRSPFVFSSTSCWYICKKSSSQQMKLTVHPIRARPGQGAYVPLQTHPKSSFRRSLLSALAPLPQQRRSDGLIPLTWATNVRSDIAATSDPHEERGLALRPGAPTTRGSSHTEVRRLPPAEEPQVTRCSTECTFTCLKIHR